MIDSCENTFILSGASGAIGQVFLARLLNHWPDSPVICLVRSEAACELIRKAAGPVSRNIRFVAADLIDPAMVRNAAREIGLVGPVLGVHAAADVSWERSAEEMASLNVEGTSRFAELLGTISASPRMVYLSTAYTRTENWTYRNGYEETKAEAERRLITQFECLPISTFACSLVVGSTTDGQIGRYNGIYPVVRFLAELAPPFLVGRKDAMLDIVPVDWVCDELVRLCTGQIAGKRPLKVVAAAGPGRRIAFERLVRITEDRIASFFGRHGLSQAEPVPIIKNRQWSFLKRSLERWQPPELSIGDFRQFERLMRVYGSYSENMTVLDPVHTARRAPDPEHYLPKVVDRWLNDHTARIIRRRCQLSRTSADV